MQAIVFEKFGNASVLKTASVERPTAQEGEVLIRIRHTSVNPVDWKIREGYLASMLPHSFPIIPGWDAAGEIAALGKGVTQFTVGEQVYAYTRLPEVHSGTYAEWIAVPAHFVAPVPKGLSTAEAASLPLVSLTAYQAITEILKLKAGDRILVTGGAGGVGSMAIQIAKALGAHVTSTAGRQNQAYLKELGVDTVIDYTKEAKSGESAVATAARATTPGGFDAIFDGVGGDALKEVAPLIKDGGRVVSIVETPEATLFQGKNVTSQFHFVYPNGEQLKAIGRLFEQGRVRVPALEVRSVKEAAAAQDANQARHVRGKVVLAIDF